MDLTPELLGILRCPVTRQPLRIATPEELEHLSRITGTTWPEALATTDGARFYPVRDGFPILLRDEAVERPTDSAGGR